MEIDLNPNNQGAKKLAELPSAPKVVVDADNFNITSPVDIEAPKVEIPEIVAVAPKVVVEPKPETIVEKPVLPLSEAKSVAAPDNANQLAQEQVSKIEDLKNQEILALKQTVEELEKEIAALKKQKAKPAVVKKAAKKVTKKAAPKKRAPVVKRASSQWELRAAQPGKAWVSKKGQSELQPVMVGDNLDGIGRIQSITYQKNQWIVTGSSGSIKQ